MKLLKYRIVIGIMMLVVSTISVSAETLPPAAKTPGFEIAIFLVAIGIAVLALILYRVYRGRKKKKKALGYEYPGHEKGKL
jgi:hypothetical protein